MAQQTVRVQVLEDGLLLQERTTEPINVKDYGPDPKEGWRQLNSRGTDTVHEAVGAAAVAAGVDFYDEKQREGSHDIGGKE